MDMPAVVYIQEPSYTYICISSSWKELYKPFETVTYIGQSDAQELINYN